MQYSSIIKTVNMSNQYPGAVFFCFGEQSSVLSEWLSYILKDTHTGTLISSTISCLNMVKCVEHHSELNNVCVTPKNISNL